MSAVRVLPGEKGCGRVGAAVCPGLHPCGQSPPHSDCEHLKETSLDDADRGELCVSYSGLFSQFD